MNRIRFWLDGEVVEADITDPTRTLLQYLREDLRRVGTKEGCAEGDCGACTVVLAELQGDALSYRAINACIQFLPTLDGKALFTVESLKSADGVLHPVQRSLVECHGSQCGFCTPGFVMSMFALYQQEAAPSRADIDDALSGNLCRCTGYRPIIDACYKMHDYPRVDVDEAELVAALRDLGRGEGLSVELERASYHAPVSLAELARLYRANPAAKILAGGTDIGLWVTKQLRDLPALIYLGNVAELQRVEETRDGIEIGAAVSLQAAFAVLAGPWPEFAQMFRRFASLPVRNAGTLVGNVANGSPIGDSMPALIAVGTRARLRLGEEVRDMALEDLYLDYMKNAMRPGEFIESITVPARSDGLLLRCYKLSKRFDQDISAVCAAFALRLDGDAVDSVRIALGGMAAVPQRATATEQWLPGRRWDEDTARAAMQCLRDEFTPLSDMRASADYRGRASANLLYRFFLETRPRDSLAPVETDVFAVTA